MFFVVELIAESVLGALAQEVSSAIGGALTRRPFRGSIVRCDIRAAGGRVYNMGTEWSSGLATVTPGHISFAPSMGVVGNREIDVDVNATGRLGRSRTDTRYRKATIVELVTPKGNLEWSLDTGQLKRAAELLADTAAKREALTEPFE